MVYSICLDTSHVIRATYYWNSKLKASKGEKENVFAEVLSDQTPKLRKRFKR